MGFRMETSYQWQGHPYGLATPFCEISGLAYTIAEKWWWKKLLEWVELVYMRNHLLGKLLKITSHR